MNKYKFTIPKDILILLILSFVLNAFRIILFGKFSLIYVLWNLFLAFIPFVISFYILKSFKDNKLTKISFYIWGIIWLLFIPNSLYIITDFIHIGEIHSVPVLYDTFLLFSSAWTGLLLGMYSIYHIEQIIKNKYSQNIASLCIFIVIIFSSFGIFLGRFLRFNSWDIFSKPMSFINAVVDVLTNRSDYQASLLYTLLFILFISMSYYSWKSTKTK